MPQSRQPVVRRPFVIALCVAAMGAGALVADAAAAQPASAERQPARSQAQAAPPRSTATRDADAKNTRAELVALLQRHPPAVAHVLKLDPSLMRDESYLNTYPMLRDFLAEHPEIPQNASYYFGQVYEGQWEPRNPRMEMISGTLAGLAGFTALIIVLSTLVWLIRTVLEQRRWSRLSKIQAEVHSKLMDRFSSNDELLTYVQTPSGRRFLESGPSPLQQEGPRTISAPFSRILWSVQLGIVLLVAGAGLLYVSTETVEEAREFFFIFGSLTVALGAGFAVSAAASYALSRKLGLFEPPASDHA
jgi:hypothetical protein